MTSLKTYNDKRGFSLIELLIVLALVAFVASIGTIFSMSSISRSYALSERDLLVSLLTQARAHALANVHESAQSVYIDTDAYVLYEGTTYDVNNVTNKVIPKVSHATVSGLDTITFNQITARVTNEGTITIAGDTQTYTIEVNNEGRINW